MKSEIDVASELADIGNMLASASLLATVRKEVASVMREGAVVLNASEYGDGDYKVVVKCGSQEDGVARRIKASMPNMDVDRIATGVLGIRTARRGKLKG